MNIDPTYIVGGLVLLGAVLVLLNRRSRKRSGTGTSGGSIGGSGGSKDHTHEK
jgi:hypothetical protein